MVPDRKDKMDVGESKTDTELGVKIARPLRRRRGEIPTRE